MPLRIDNATTQQLGTRQDDNLAQDPSSQEGVWRGANVQVAASAEDLLTDAAEEITMEHSEHVESHKLEEREIEEEPPLQLPNLEEILTYLESSGKQDQQEKLQQFVEALKRNSQQGSDTSPREESRRQFGNETEQFLALSYAARALEQEGGHDALLAQVRESLQDLHEDAGSQIRANLNTIQAAAEFGAGNAEQVAAFQSTYRDAVLNGQNLGAMLKGTLERFGTDDYRGAVRSLIRALGDDLSSIRGASVQPNRLNAVLQDLYQMEVLATLLDGCQSLSSKMTAKHQLPAISAGILMQDLVAASGERWSNGSRFSAIAQKHGADEPPARVEFLTQAKHLVREMPVKVFADTDARSNVLDAAQAALDDAIALEEEDAS
ncbi:type III secretion system gatekeeper subunit SctW [Peristeroidobacter soli]|uniref:type III secretion system gatekeeper subunit SctW n=1 Tax=Peristeroidobacter soli TaxID=2497877 RepID=UPI00101CA208|nr:type III secretion system gatekeeper subunit SctW [Peristeroidobacter soli]